MAYGMVEELECSVGEPVAITVLLGGRIVGQSLLHPRLTVHVSATDELRRWLLRV